jgi:hypothetical protein
MVSLSSLRANGIAAQGDPVAFEHLALPRQLQRAVLFVHDYAIGLELAVRTRPSEVCDKSTYEVCETNLYR